jgi:hypothetical protein
MSLHLSKEVLSVIEVLLVAATLCAYTKNKSYRGFPAFGFYLGCRLVVQIALISVLYGVRFSLIEKHVAYGVYYYSYWIGYLAGAGFALLAIQEIFKHLMKPFPSLGRYGLMAFRWVSLCSVVVALAVAVYPGASNRSLLVAATGGAMRCMSILELCLLAFIVLSMQTLHLSPRSREFGVALGLGLIAAADLFGSTFAFGNLTLASIADFSCQIVVTLGSAVWLIYFIKSGAEAPVAASSASSPLLRWNEIASALAPPAPQITLAPAPSNFFLQDVEKAVDRVLEKNSGSRAS